MSAISTAAALGYLLLEMVTEKDRAHFQRIAAIEAELNREAVHAAAARTPGENIEIGLALSEFAAAFGGDLSHADEVPPIQLWRARHRTPT